MPLNWAKKDMIGKRFGRLLVLSEIEERTENGSVSWNCLCDCGNKTIGIGSVLRAGKKNSCGCLALESVRIEKYMASFNKLYAAYKRGAKHRGHSFTISKETFKIIVKSNCFYCGEEPKQICQNNGKGNFYGNFIYNGIDRIDNTLGYVASNIVPCCFKCNQMKLSKTQEDFLKKIKNIYEYLKL